MVVYVIPVSIVGIIMFCVLAYAIAPVLLVPLALLFAVLVTTVVMILMDLAKDGDKSAETWCLLGIAVIAILVFFVFAHLDGWLDRLPYTSSLSDGIENCIHYAYSIAMVISSTICGIAAVKRITSHSYDGSKRVCKAVGAFAGAVMILSLVQLLTYRPVSIIRQQESYQSTGHFTLQVLNASADTDEETIGKVFAIRTNELNKKDVKKGIAPTPSNTTQLAEKVIRPNTICEYSLKSGIYTFTVGHIQLASATLVVKISFGVLQPKHFIGVLFILLTTLRSFLFFIKSQLVLFG